MVLQQTVGQKGVYRYLFTAHETCTLKRDNVFCERQWVRRVFTGMFLQRMKPVPSNGTTSFANDSGSEGCLQVYLYIYRRACTGIPTQTHMYGY
jgi:hypothetical protein